MTWLLYFFCSSARGEVLQKNAADCREVSLALGGPDVLGFSVIDNNDGTFLCRDITHESGGVIVNADLNSVRELLHHEHF